MTITKQRVEEIISRIEMYGHGAGYTADEVMTWLYWHWWLLLQELCIMFNDISDAMQNMWERYWDSMKTCHYMMVQLSNRIDVVPDTGVHDIKCMCSTRAFSNANN